MTEAGNPSGKKEQTTERAAIERRETASLSVDMLLGVEGTRVQPMVVG